MLLGLGVLASLAFALSACGSSGDNGGETTTVTANKEPNAANQVVAAKAGAQVYASAGCGSCHTFKAANSKGTTGPNLNEYLEPDDNRAGIEEMIVDPNAEIAEGYSANVMPQNFGETLDAEEVKQLVAFLYVNSPASEGHGGEQVEKEEEAK